MECGWAWSLVTSFDWKWVGLHAHKFSFSPNTHKVCTSNRKYSTNTHQRIVWSQSLSTWDTSFSTVHVPLWDCIFVVILSALFIIIGESNLRFVWHIIKQSSPLVPSIYLRWRPLNFLALWPLKVSKITIGSLCKRPKYNTGNLFAALWL